jgi:hypothetical protein
MGMHHSPRIIKSGLQLYVDPKDINSYPGSGTAIYDLSGNGRTGTMNDGASATGGYIRCADNADDVSFGTGFTIAREKTLSIWIRSDRPLSTQDNWEVGFLNQGTTQGSMFGFMYGVGNCQDLGFWGYGASYDMSVESATNKWSSDGNWHNGVITMDSSRNVRVWTDGVQRQWLKHSDYSTKTYTVQMPIDTTNYFLINSRSTWNSGLSYVDLGNVMVYNRALTEEEILQNYEAQKTRFEY